MITHLEIRNFRCIREASVPLKGLTVLVGANDTGKTAFLDAIRALTGSKGIAEMDFGRGERKLEIVGIAEGSRGALQIPHDANSNPMHQLENWRNAVGQAQYFRLPSRGVPMQSGSHVDSLGWPVIGPEGQNIPAFLDYLVRRDRKRFDDIVAALKDLIPGLEDVILDAPAENSKSIDLVIDNGFGINADLTSTGVKLMVFFLALAYHPSPPGVILIEEPESGIHPQRLVDVVHLMRDVTRGTHGDKASQVIMTTHSPYLLDLVDPEQDQVLVFQRKESGDRSVSPADPKRLKSFLGEFLLGEVWYNEGEQGLLAKK